MGSIAARADGLQTDIFQVISPGISSVVTVGAVSSTLSMPTSGVTVLRLFATADCFVAFGSSPTAAVEGSGSLFLPAGIVEYFERKDGETLAVIAANSATGKLYVTEGASS
jgi:hypothetical protein